MTNRETLINRIEVFYVDVIEEFKEAELQIMNDSKFVSLFRKKDYAGNIARLKQCKKDALNIGTADLKKEDEDTKELITSFSKNLTIFNALCDAYVQLQVFLQKKANKEKVQYSLYKEIYSKVEQHRSKLNETLHEMDILYTDFTELDKEQGEKQ